MPNALLPLLLALFVAIPQGPSTPSSPGCPGVYEAGEVELSSADGALRLSIADLRGKSVERASECSVELRRDGKRVYRRRLELGVRHAFLGDDGRVVLAGEARREVIGTRADVHALCFLGPDGDTLAVHESSLPASERTRDLGCMSSGNPPTLADARRSVDHILPVADGWTLVVERFRRGTFNESRLRTFDERGMLLGELDGRALTGRAKGSWLATDVAVFPNSSAVVVLWLDFADPHAPDLLTVHDLHARYANATDRREDLRWSGTLPDGRRHGGLRADPAEPNRVLVTESEWTEDEPFLVVRSVGAHGAAVEEP